MQGYYYTIEKPGQAEFKDRGSKFIALAFPVEDVQAVKEKLAEVRKDYPKATHYCFAYRLGTDGSQYRVSDDGEPSGSAGRPILGQIDSRGATNVLVVVVRYFGGTQLGLPGLIAAYKTSASLVLQVVPLQLKPILYSCRLQFDYTRMNEVMRILKQSDCVVLKQDNNLFCTLEVGVPVQRKEEIFYKIAQLPGVELIGTAV